MKAKKRYSTYDALFFAKLACYTDPYCEQAWKKFINLYEDIGEFKKAAEISKTAYLLIPNE